MATYERRCSNCGKWTTSEIRGSIVKNDFGKCAYCRFPFGPVGIGDKLIDGDKLELVNPKTHGRQGPVAPAEEPKLPTPAPGQEGYRAPKATR